MSEENFSRFGKKFQESLAQLIFDDRAFADQIGEVLDYNFFELKFHREFVKKVYDYRKKYETHPSKEIFGSYLNTEFNEGDLLDEQIKNFFELVKSQPIKDILFIKDKAIDFCKKQKIKEAILKSVELLGDEQYDQIEKIVRDAVNLGLSNEAGHDYKEDFAIRYEDDYRGRIIPTGWPELNDCMGGGLAAGETGVFIAPTGTGKSFLLSHVGATAVKQNFNVVHFIMELNEKKIGRRYDSILTTIPLDDLKLMKHNVWNTVKDIKGKLEIIKHIPNRITVNTLYNNIEKIKKRRVNSFNPDMIIVDYGDLVNPSGEFQTKVDGLQSVFEDLQRMAEEFQVPVWTATQTNRCLKKDTELFIKRNEEKLKILIQDINIGDVVDTHLGWKKVVGKFNSKERLFKIKLKSGKEVVCSSKHLFPTSDGELSSINKGLCTGKKLLVKKSS